MRVLSCEKSLYLEYGPSIYHTKSPEIEIEREKKKKVHYEGKGCGKVGRELWGRDCDYSRFIFIQVFFFFPILTSCAMSES